MKKDEKKKKKWELDRIMARERPIVEDPTHDTFLCVWKDTILDSIEDLEKEQQDFRTDRVVKMDDGKYLVTWAPTWEPASDIRRDAPKPVNEWRKYEKFMKESHSTETKAAAPPRHVVHSDSETDASSCYSSRSPEPVGTFIDHHGGPRKPYFLKSITGLDPYSVEKDGILPSCPRDAECEHDRSTIVIDAELEALFVQIRQGPLGREG